MAEGQSRAAPSYDNAPVVETVLGVQFDRLERFKNAHLGTFWKTLDVAEWPTVVDAASLPTQVETFDVARWARGMQLQLTQDPACRIRITNRNADRMIQLQNNRLHLNWLDTENRHYPRYEQVRDEFASVLQHFLAFVDQEDVGDCRPNHWEVTYVNEIPKGSVWNTPDDWDFFKLLRAAPPIGDVAQPESFEGEWHFVMPDRLGRLHINWQPGRKTKDGIDTIRLTLTARGGVNQSEERSASQTVLDGLDLGRRTIVTVFRELMSDQANEYWKLRHVGN